MKFAIMMIVVFGPFAASASAQDTKLQLNVESVASVRPQPPRSPMMVATGAPAQPAVTEADAPADASKAQVNRGGKAAAMPGAASKMEVAESGEATAAPNPIVLPGAQTSAPAVNLGFESTGNPKYDELIKQSAARNGIDPNLIVAVMRHESGYNLRATSYKGAMGLMQLMPATARRFGVTNYYDPAQNIEGGARYLRFLMDTFNGDTKLVLAGYNAGENAVINYGYQVPPYRETKHYVRAISARYDKKKAPGMALKTVAANEGPVAPVPTTFAGGSSSRLSNNY
jgi:soluble lytic murein transglycosylase-like protein